MNLYWTITEKCQLKCKYCYYQVGICNRNKEDINLDLFKSRIPGISKHIESITFTGGEVLLLPYFWDLVEAARACDVKVNILTDGIRFDEANLNKAMELGVSGVSISLDSLDDDVNELQRPPRINGNHTTQRIINNTINASRFIGENFMLTLNQTITRQNIASIVPMVDFTKKYNLRHLVHLAGVPSTPDYNFLNIEKCTSEELSELEHAMKVWSSGNHNFKDYTQIALSFLGKKLLFAITCPMMKESLNIKADGGISPCFFKTDISLGNIYTSDILLILKEIQTSEIGNGRCATLGCACMLKQKKEIFL